jgi:hypothetical protein
VLEKADLVKAGPYSFKLPHVPLNAEGDKNFISYVVLTGQPDEVVASFNAITVPPNKWFFDDCEEQNADSSIQSATDKMVTLHHTSWMFCEGAAHGYGAESSQTIIMQPKPHLIAPGDLFREEVDWRSRLADLAPDQKQSVRDAAVDPKNWALTPTALVIDLGFVNGYAGGQSALTIPWNKLDGLLVANPPFQ